MLHAPDADPNGTSHDVPHVHGSLLLLPQEVWDHIIDNLYDDRGALKGCALTCRAWLRTAHILLWWKLTFNGVSNARSLLHKFPDVAGMVRELFVFVEIREVPSLSAFTNLWKLDLNCSEVDEQDLVQYIPQELRLRSVRILVLHTLYHFMSATSLERLLMCFPHLTSLTVGGGSDHRGLRDLQAESLPQTSPISLPHLRKLIVTAGHLSSSLPTILRSAGASLELAALCIPQAIPSGILPNILDFSQNENLVRLDINRALDTYCCGWGDCLASVISQLNARHNSLIDLHLYVTSTPASPGVWCSPPGELLGREVARILDVLPSVVVTFCKVNSYSSYAAHQGRRSLADHLLRRFPGLRIYPTRVRFASNLDLCGGGMLNEGLEQRRVSKGLWSVPLFDV